MLMNSSEGEPLLNVEQGLQYEVTDKADWTSRDIGEAMANCARQMADNIKEKEDCLDFNAWWRGGEGRKVRVWLNSGAWRDIRDGVGGNGSDFAELAFGGTLTDLMDIYNPEPTGEQPTPKTPQETKRTIWDEIENPCTPQVNWQEILDELPPYRNALVARGLPDGEIYGISQKQLNLFPHKQADWLSYSMQNTPYLIAVPFRRPDGVCTGMHIRGPDGKDIKKHITGSQFKGMGTVGYGQGIDPNKDLWAVEGMFDTLIVGSAYTNVFGCVSAEMFTKLTEWIISTRFDRRVFLGFHLDKSMEWQGGAGQEVALSCFEKLIQNGSDVYLLQWDVLLNRLAGSKQASNDFLKDKTSVDLGDCVEWYGLGRTIRCLTQCAPEFGDFNGED